MLCKPCTAAWVLIGAGILLGKTWLLFAGIGLGVFLWWRGQ
jgi:hypothetical protein